MLDAATSDLRVAFVDIFIILLQGYRFYLKKPRKHHSRHHSKHHKEVSSTCPSHPCLAAASRYSLCRAATAAPTPIKSSPSPLANLSALGRLTRMRG